MKNREQEKRRLTEIIKQDGELCEDCENKCIQCWVHRACAAEAEHLMKHNVVLLPDIPFGTVMYQIWAGKIYKLKLKGYHIREIDGERIVQFILIGDNFTGGGNVEELGKTVFLDREDARKVLEGGGSDA